LRFRLKIIVASAHIRITLGQFLKLCRFRRVYIARIVLLKFKILTQSKNMKTSISARISINLLLIVAMLTPTAALAAGDGKKHFKEGMRQENSEVWDKAVEEFALAVAESPKNPEYRLHLQRALFNASQMYMKRGATAANEGDYEGGYNAFRKAYAFDPTNELAKAEMDRMVRLKQSIKDGQNPDTKKDANGKANYVQTGYNTQGQPDPQTPQRVEKLRDLPFPSGVNLPFIIKELAKELDLNVLFDSGSRLDGRSVRIELHQVTAAKALDYIFLQEALFFQRVGPRTILVADNNRRTNFQQLVLRTFYLANANPKDVQTIIQSAIPAQPGRSQTIVLKDDATNSITVRDTSENVALISKLISSLDKDRAEVVMDVAIYEVNKSDLMQFGNQLGIGGNSPNLTNLGGVGFPIIHAGSTQPITGGLPFTGTDALSIAFGLPLSSIQALQTKNNTKLVASTQIHSFNNQDSSARIGQRVPVQSAQIISGNGVTSNNGSNGFVSNVINYEQVGLTLKFKPLIFPNQDVQVDMEIESKDVSGALTATPVFTERTIKGTARIQNNKTLLLASVAQNNESNGRSGLPLLGLIPILGRLFTAPTRDNRQVDIVIAVTPRVIRAPSILPEDEAERPTGSIATPTSGSLEAMVNEEDRQELLAAARRIPNTAAVQLPDQKADAPVYVKTGSAPSGAQNAKATADPNRADAKGVPSMISNLRPIDSSAKTLQVNQTSDTSVSTSVDPKPAAAKNTDAETALAPPNTEVKLPATIAAMKAGEKVKIPVLVNSSAAFRSAVVGLKFDSKKLAVRSVSFGDVFGASLAGTTVTPFVNENGKMYVTLTVPDGAAPLQTGVLAYVEIEALADVTPSMELDKDVLNFLTADGKNFALRF
jgi:general secretion pathway protein D